MALFKPLDSSLSALTTFADPPPAPTPSTDPPSDLGGDDTFRPPCADPYRRRGADDAEEAVDYTSSDDDGYSSPASAALDDLGAWASGGGGDGANLTARLRPRANANGGHSRLEDRLDRADDRRRENVARDKVDRATVEQVLDPRTRMILFRLLSRGRLASIDGCVSTGKEANVYFGTAPEGCVAAEGAEGVDVAVKVFKTAILTFKDRERYVAGEFRFRRGGYNRQSNRKMVQQWTEKEYRNLVRLREADVPSPTPLVIKPPVLIMEFFGRDGWPAPRLKDASLSLERLTAVYGEVCVLMRRMFTRAKLVHGDLSEYNILYHRRQVVIIDVSQSVEGDHPMALDFLRRDCVNIRDFFARAGVTPVLGLRELFEFITDGEGVFEGVERRPEEDAWSEAAMKAALLRAEGRSEEEQVRIELDDVVFNQSFIPRSLNDVYNCDQDMHRTTENDPEARERYANLTGNLCEPDMISELQITDGDGAEGVDSQPGGSDDEDDEDDGEGSWVSDERLTADERKEMRKSNKKEVRAAASKRREEKTPKHVKKRKEVVAKRKRHVKSKK